MSTGAATRDSWHPLDPLAAVVAVLIAVLLGGLDLSSTDFLLWVSVASTLIALRGFLVLGGPSISPPAVYCAGHALMVGLAGVWIATVGYLPTSVTFLNVAALVLLGQLMILQYLAWNWWVVPSPLAPPRRLGLVLLVALGLLGAAAALHTQSRPDGYSTDTLGLLAEGVAAAGLVCLVLWLGWVRRSLVLSLLALVVCLGLYQLLFHHGGGRIRIAVVGVSLAAAISAQFSHRLLKRLCVLAIPGAVGTLALDRVLFLRTQDAGTDAGTGESTGLESLISPLWSFSRVLDAADHQVIAYRNGASFLTPFGDWLVQEPAFGYAVASITRPWIDNPSYSDAAHLAGEFVWNFGLPGLLLCPIALVALRLLVRRSTGPTTLAGVFLTALLCLAAGTVLELEWGGVHIAVLRFATRASPLIALLACCLLARPLGRLDAPTSHAGSRVDDPLPTHVTDRNPT